MNDPTEFMFGLKKIMELLPQIENDLLVEDKDRLSQVWKDDDIRVLHIQKLRETFRLPFVVCFSNNKDYLPQWVMYGDKGRGVSLGFDIQDYYRVITYKGKRIIDMTNISDGKLRAIRVSYKRISIGHFFKNCVSLFYREYLKKIKDNESGLSKEELKISTLSTIAYYLSSIIKHKAYSYEAESRILYSITNSNDIKFKTNRQGLPIPYMEIGIETNRLKKIIVGPCCDFESTKMLLQTRLRQLGLEKVKIIQSKIPYRA